MDSAGMAGMPTNMAPPSTPTAAMAVPMAMPNPQGMDSGGDMLMGMSVMSMTFFHSAATPLFWDWWKPNGSAQYAATCAFLILLAAVTRILFAIRPGIYTRGRGWSEEPIQSIHQHAGDHLLPSDEKIAAEIEDSGSDLALASGGGARGMMRRWWCSVSLASRLWRACCEVALVCLGYFL